MNTTFKLPKGLEFMRSDFANTLQSFVEIIPRTEAKTTWWESKVGGHPYLPKETEYPKDTDGNDLAFLAQINFEEVPPLDSFPKKGILQFYIGGDDLYGLDFDNPTEQNRFRILFFEKIIEDEKQLTTDFSFVKRYGSLPFNPSKSFPIDFLFSQEIISPGDYQFDEKFQEKIMDKAGEEVVDEFYEMDIWAKHKMHGYPYFTQYDVRDSEDPMILLFQLDSDDGMEIMWGDVGVCNFFIRKEDLEKKDFSNVLYNWDCT